MTSALEEVEENLGENSNLGEDSLLLDENLVASALTLEGNLGLEHRGDFVVAKIKRVLVVPTAATTTATTTTTTATTMSIEGRDGRAAAATAASVAEDTEKKECAIEGSASGRDSGGGSGNRNASGGSSSGGGSVGDSGSGNCNASGGSSDNSGGGGGGGSDNSNGSSDSGGADVFGQQFVYREELVPFAKTELVDLLTWRRFCGAPLPRGLGNQVSSRVHRENMRRNEMAAFLRSQGFDSKQGRFQNTVFHDGGGVM
jgi:hypothetical protein